MKETKSVMDIALVIQKALKSIKGLSIESRELTLRVPEKTCEDDIAIRVRHPAIRSRKITFDIPNLNHVTVHTLGSATPPMKIVDSSLIRTSSGFDVCVNNVPKGVEYLLFQLEYDLPTSSFAENIVRTDSQLEAYEDLDTYWMHACLKHPRVLRNMFQRLNLKNVEFDVDVAIGNTVKSAIPSYFIRQLTLLREIASWQDRSSSHRLLSRIIQGRRKIGKNPYEILTQIEALMEPKQFKNFIDIKLPFKYSNITRGADYESDTMVFPNEMTVISRTNLSLDDPAANGKLLYKKKEFRTELDKLFG